MLDQKNASSYSQKVQSLMVSPQYRLDENNTYKGGQKFDFTNAVEFVFENRRLSDKFNFYAILMDVSLGIGIETLVYKTRHQGPELAFVDAVCEMIRGTRFTQSDGMAVIHVEAFLRDQKDVPSFPNHATTMYPIFEFKSKLVEHIRNYLTGEGETTKGEFRSPTIAHDYIGKEHSVFDSGKRGAFNKLTRQEQFFVAQEIVDVLIRPLLQRDKGDLSLVHVDEGMAIIAYSGNCFHCQNALTTTMDFIQHVFRHELNSARFLVATDN